MSRTAGTLVLAVALTLAGCGGDDNSEFTRENVQDTMSDAIRGQLPEGTTIDQLECVEDGDNLHWRCFTTALEGEQRYRMTVAITCDEETGRCISEPAIVAPVP